MMFLVMLFGLEPITFRQSNASQFQFLWKEIWHRFISSHKGLCCVSKYGIICALVGVKSLIFTNVPLVKLNHMVQSSYDL